MRHEDRIQEFHFIIALIIAKNCKYGYSYKNIKGLWEDVTKSMTSTNTILSLHSIQDNQLQLNQWYSNIKYDPSLGIILKRVANGPNVIFFIGENPLFF